MEAEPSNASQRRSGSSPRTRGAPERRAGERPPGPDVDHERAAHRRLEEGAPAVFCQGSTSPPGPAPWRRLRSEAAPLGSTLSSLAASSSARRSSSPAWYPETNVYRSTRAAPVLELVGLEAAARGGTSERESRTGSGRRPIAGLRSAQRAGRSPHPVPGSARSVPGRNGEKRASGRKGPPRWKKSRGNRADMVKCRSVNRTLSSTRAGLSFSRRRADWNP